MRLPVRFCVQRYRASALPAAATRLQVRSVNGQRASHCLRQTGPANAHLLRRHRLSDLELVRARRFSRCAATTRRAAWTARWSTRTSTSASTPARARRGRAHAPARVSLWLDDGRGGSHARGRAKRAKATITPQVVVVDAAARSAIAAASTTPMPISASRASTSRRTTCAMSLDAVLAGRPVPNPETEALGCYIVDPASLRRKSITMRRHLLLCLLVAGGALVRRRPRPDLAARGRAQRRRR